MNVDFTIFFSKNKWQNLLSYTLKHKNRHSIYVSSVCSCKIIRKKIYFYIRWRPSWISPFWTIFSTYKKMQSLFFLIFMIFWVRIKWKINFNRQNARKCYMWHMSLHYIAKYCINTIMELLSKVKYLLIFHSFQLSLRYIALGETNGYTHKLMARHTA